MRSRRSSRRLRPLLLAVALAIFVLATIVGAHWWRHRGGIGQAREELATALGAFEGGAMTRARLHARQATIAAPDWGLAWAVLGRIDLARGEGDTAELELKRAVASGFPSARSHQMLAHADLLQGDAIDALAEAAKTPPRYAGYATRVRARAMAMTGDAIRANLLLGRWVDAQPGDAAGWAELARIRFNAGDIGGAITAASRAVAADPANGDALVLRGELVRAQFGLIAALPWFEAALHRDPGNRQALVDYAATLGDAGRTADALAVTRRLLALDPRNIDALYFQAVIAARAGDDELTGRLLDRIGARGASIPGIQLLRAATDYRAEHWRAAADTLDDLVASQPLNWQARRLLGAALLRAGDLKEAIRAIAPIAGRADADRYALNIAARAYYAQGRIDWAGQALDRANLPIQAEHAPFATGDTLDVWQQAAGVSPDNADVTIDFIKALVEAQRAPDAMVVAQRLMRASPNAPFPYLVIGDILAGSARWPDAAAAYRRAAALRFDEPTMLRLIDAFDRSGQRAEAQRSLTLYLSQNPQSLVALRLAGAWQLAAGDADAAIASLERVRAAVGNQDAVLLSQLARAYLASRDAPAARRFAAHAYRLSPLDPAITDDYGWVLHATGDDRAAEPLLAKAVAIAPGATGPRMHLDLVRRALTTSAR